MLQRAREQKQSPSSKRFSRKTVSQEKGQKKPQAGSMEEETLSYEEVGAAFESLYRVREYEDLLEKPQNEEEKRGRTLARGKTHKRSSSLELLKDTYFQQTSASIEEEVASWHEEKAKLEEQGFTLEGLREIDLFKVVGAYGLEGLGAVVHKVDDLTFGGVSAVGEGWEKAARASQTAVRRGVRNLTHNQRLGQNAGDYFYLGLSVLGPKKLLALLDLGKLTRLVSKGAKKADTLESLKNFEQIDSVAIVPKPKNVVDKTSFSADSRIIPLERRGFVMFDGVEFRAVRDLGHLSEEHLWKMYKTGSNPYDIFGNKLAYHHIDQIPQRKPGSAYALVLNEKHNIWNKAQHPKGNSKNAGLTVAERIDSDKLVRIFNKELAQNELKKRGLL
ncbi:hypothetical protein IM40_07360 [Candidatus Paracaedimonas acanthamoebae]|nr:hypothetical protein IM40_07360 [Candidatus Paracaedimonas acanthamoebae]